ncbi:MAG: TetR/AcrR family transcriptional regulator, partial [Firmicutes bacterium]|nr:TetR/AcrR family transcriptional regulator [Bacillota bacterium]
MKKYTKTDRRVSKTRNAITNTLLKLMEEKPLSEITVSELTELADVNRKTFYNHYENMDSVIIELENNCSNWILSFVEDAPMTKFLNEPAAMYIEIAEGLQRHKDLLHLLYESGVYSKLSRKLSENLKNSVWEKTKDEFKPEFRPKAYLLLDFLNAGVVGIYDTMFNKDDPTPLEDVKEFFDFVFAESNLQAVLKEGLK